ncbi:hypothetical protein VNO77_43963 [Canavalia gladiata]|uniref:Uncharacterized protein n=1 Tax=Canavalia gladiata TaxID=3824 RepID=A0AAN9PQB2_CANGL
MSCIWKLIMLEVNALEEKDEPQMSRKVLGITVHPRPGGRRRQSENVDMGRLVRFRCCGVSLASLILNVVKVFHKPKSEHKSGVVRIQIPKPGDCLEAPKV